MGVRNKDVLHDDTPGAAGARVTRQVEDFLLASDMLQVM